MSKFLIIAMTTIVFAMSAMAGGGLEAFLDKVNNQARADLGRFSAKISAQFGVPEAQVKVVLEKVGEPADAFMVFQVGQMSRQPTESVMKVYQSGKGRGWGALAKDLGIKPGSKEFHALKRGDLRFDGESDEPASSSPGKGKGKGKNKHND